MLTRFQVYALVAGILAGVGVVILSLVWPMVFSTGSISLAPAVEPQRSASDEREPVGNSSEQHREHQETQLPEGHFRLTAKTHSVAKYSTGIEEAYDGDAELMYAHQKVPGGILLTFYSLGLRTFDKGKLAESRVLSRDEHVIQSGSHRIVQSFDELPPDMQQKLKASFAKPFCKISLDDDYNETQREFLGEPGKSIITEGLMNSARLVHCPFLKRSTEWTGFKRIPIQGRMVIDCPVQYTRTSDGTKVKVVGSIVASEIPAASPDMAIQNVSASISGTELFDERIEEYTSGELVIHYSFQLIEGDAPPVALSGEVTVTLERVGERKP